MAAVLGCAVTTLRRLRKKRTITEGVYAIPDSRLLLFDRELVLQQLRKHTDERRTGR
jgi:hypothetical protein